MLEFAEQDRYEKRSMKLVQTFSAFCRAALCGLALPACMASSVFAGVANQPPVANPDVLPFIPSFRSPIIISVESLIANDTDPEGPISFAGVDGFATIPGIPTQTDPMPERIPVGTLKVPATNPAIVEFRPNAQFAGLATISYSIQDSAGVAVRGTADIRTSALVSGLYGGLLPIPAVGTLPPGGLLRFSVSRTGTITGTIIHRGTRASFRGLLGVDGRSVIEIPQPESASIVLNLAFDIIDGTPNYTGTLTFPGGNPVGITGIRGASKAVRAQLKGRYTINFSTIGAGPLGTGWATMDLGSSGATASLRGRLTDGTSFSCATVYGSDGTIPIYTHLYRQPRGHFTGTLLVEGSPLVVTTLIVPPTANPPNRAPLTFVKPAQAKVDRFFPAGFATNVSAAGQIYVPPTAGALPIQGAPFTLTLSGGEVIVPLIRAVQLVPTGVILVNGGVFENLKISFSPSRGTVTGNFNHPATTERVQVTGVIRQDLNQAQGVFNAGTSTGSLRITPPPPTPSPTQATLNNILPTEDPYTFPLLFTVQFVHTGVIVIPELKPSPSSFHITQGVLKVGKPGF